MMTALPVASAKSAGQQGSGEQGVDRVVLDQQDPGAGRRRGGDPLVLGRGDGLRRLARGDQHPLGQGRPPERLDQIAGEADATNEEFT